MPSVFGHSSADTFTSKQQERQAYQVIITIDRLKRDYLACRTGYVAEEVLSVSYQGLKLWVENFHGIAQAVAYAMRKSSSEKWFILAFLLWFGAAICPWHHI